MARRVSVTGDQRTIRNMRVIARTPARVIDTAAVAALDPMKKETERGAMRLRQPGKKPKGGHLDEGVRVRKVEARGAMHRVFWLGFVNRARRIAHLVEFGTAPHWQPRRRIMHPGARAKPFARPAYEQEKDDAGLHFGRAIWRAIVGDAKGMK